VNFRERIRMAQESQGSLVCLGLDLGPNRVPDGRFAPVPGEPLPLTAGKMVVGATRELVFAYKPNLPFWLLWPDGLEALRRMIAFIHHVAPETLVIVDGKYNDIGATQAAWATLVFDHLGADAATVNPYMGQDVVHPFLHPRYLAQGKNIIVLGQTSNKGAGDFQTRFVSPDIPSGSLALGVTKAAAEWGCACVVVGATIAEGDMRLLRQASPGLVWLMPGVGAQGGDPQLVIRYGFTEDGIGPIVNSSRGVTTTAWERWPDLDIGAASARATQELRDWLNRLKAETRN